MNRYAIYCSEEQTKKALALGAPIFLVPENFYTEEKHFRMEIEGENAAVILPTAEEMIGWLEEQGITSIEITFCKESKWKFEIFGEIYDYSAPYFSRQEATIAAIDAALDYLIETNEE